MFVMIIIVVILCVCVFSTAQKVKDGMIGAGKFFALTSPRV